jgi:hypothetical protein
VQQRLRRFALPLVVGLTIGLVVPGIATARPHASSTTVKIVSPILNGRLAAGYTTRSESAGDCQSGIRAGGINLWFRCFAGDHRVYETCLAAPGVRSGGVACVDAPWSHRVVFVRTKRPVRTGRARPVTTTSEPWGIELADGTRCVELLAVMHGYFHHRQIDFGCRNRNFGLIGVLHGLDRTTTPWTADAVVVPRGTPRPGCRDVFDGPPRCSKVRRMTIRTAFFGQDLPEQQTSLAFTGPPWDVGRAIALAALLLLLGTSCLCLGRRTKAPL